MGRQRENALDMQLSFESRAMLAVPTALRRLQSLPSKGHPAASMRQETRTTNPYWDLGWVVHADEDVLYSAPGRYFRDTS